MYWDKKKDEDRETQFWKSAEKTKNEDVTLRNFDKKAAWYGRSMKVWGNDWPYLSNKDGFRDTADRQGWDLYFRDHLGGFPPSYRLFRDGVIEHWNAPDATPELFDPTYR